MPKDREDLQKLVDLLEECERDTARLLGVGAAVRLAHWREYSGNLARLTEYVARRLVHTPENGRQLKAKGGLSLEEIVAERMPHVFLAEHVEAARFTLDRPSM